MQRLDSAALESDRSHNFSAFEKTSIIAKRTILHQMKTCANGKIAGFIASFFTLQLHASKLAGEDNETARFVANFADGAWSRTKIEKINGNYTGNRNKKHAKFVLSKSFGKNRSISKHLNQAITEKKH